jgi:hypothetical protein
MAELEGGEEMVMNGGRAPGVGGEHAFVSTARGASLGPLSRPVAFAIIEAVKCISSLAQTGL